MALNQVGTRVEGDYYQGLFFWRQAAALLIDDSRVERVVFEHDLADGVDDLAVFYCDPGVNAGGVACSADYFQIKYHVDRRDDYSSDALMDPAFATGNHSLLQRFATAYRRLSGERDWFRLHLASNWKWRDDDILARHLRESDGSLPEECFRSGSHSNLGRISKRWQEHLEMEWDQFVDFGRRLRFQLDHFGRRDFAELVSYKLQAAGMKGLPADRQACPYAGLMQNLLMDRKNEYNRSSFREMCSREGLLTAAKPNSARMPTLGIRSVLRFAERIEEDADKFVCIARYFIGRHPQASSNWEEAIAPAVRELLSDNELRRAVRRTDHRILLECHGTLAFLAGYELDRKSGARVFPVQKPGMSTWRPNLVADRHPDWEWNLTEVPLTNAAGDLAVIVSVSNPIEEDVLDFIRTSQLQVRVAAQFMPKAGPGPTAISGPDQAGYMADSLVSSLRGIKKQLGVSKVHLFASAPNAFMFFLGQHRERLGALQLYEFDFSQERHGSYEPSIAFPFSHKED